MDNIDFFKLSEARADIKVIPHGTDGSMDEEYHEYLNELQKLDMVPTNAELGSLKVIELAKRENVKYILLVCSIDGSYSNYTVIFTLMEAIFGLLNMMHPRFVTVAIPLLVEDPAVLDLLNVYQIQSASLRENVSSRAVMLSIPNEALRNQIARSEDTDINNGSQQLAVRYNILELKKESWVVKLLGERSFYFELAREVFEEFTSFSSGDEMFFSNLLKDFTEEKIVFKEYISRWSPESPEYKFLNICGRLIAYVDRNAYNKRQWNSYPDKRTMALSLVTQTNWIKSLLKYRAAQNNLNVLSPSTRNAISYIISPRSELLMLSEGHRKLVSEQILQIEYVKETFVRKVDEYLSPFFIRCINEDNRNVLYSRILYSPVIKLLWDREEVEQQPIANTITAPQLRDQQAETQQERESSLKGLIHSDSYAEVDMLGYQNYASLIAALITSKQTKPPMTIGILAPWGKGKTSLMRFIEEKIKGRPSEEKEESLRRSSHQATSSRYRLITWLKNLHKLTEIRKLSYPIVWFNAWKFQKNEQIWAGLAQAIIEQLAADLSPLEREKFYLLLNLKRVDKDKIRQSLILGALPRLILPIICSILIFTASYILIPLSKIGADPLWQALSAGASSIALIAYAIFKYLKETPGADLGKYVLQPDYKSKMGYYSSVEEDLRQALEILVDKNEPPVIFIDDLDRCAPGTITELIEAINLFTSGDMSSCYFIIGQDAQIVAGALEASYEKMGQKINNIEKNHGSIGWYFMEKFIQLQFNIPVVTLEQSKRILASLLSSEETTIISVQEQENLLAEYEKIQRSITTLDDIDTIFTDRLTELEDKILKFQPKRVDNFYNALIERVVREHGIGNLPLEEIILFISPYVKNSPRLIKRFANLYIYYQFLRYTSRSKGLREIDSLILGRWVLLMVRWPQLIRAIQWNSETNFLNGSTAELRAADFQTQIANAKNFDTWKASMKAKNIQENSWACDEELFKFFITNTDEQAELQHAVNYGLW